MGKLSPTQAERALMECLEPIVTSICRQSTGLRAVVGYNTSECPGPDDFRQHVYGAAYLAFRDLGGDPDIPGAFSWKPRNLTKIRRATMRRLNADFMGPGSNFGDFNRRMKPRRQVNALNTGRRWQSWERGVAEIAHEAETGIRKHSGNRRVPPFLGGFATPQEQALQAKQLEGFVGQATAIRRPPSAGRSSTSSPTTAATPTARRSRASGASCWVSGSS